jgi:hypothetical protein
MNLQGRLFHAWLPHMRAQPCTATHASTGWLLAPRNPAGLAYWDVFKTAQLDAFKSKPQAASGPDGSSTGGQRFTASSSKASRVQHATHSAGKLPASITSNTPKEQKLLAYVADFQRVFQEFYPYR